MSRKHVINLLSAYIHGELSSEKQSRVQAHLQECEDCRKELEKMQLGSRLAQMHRKHLAPDVGWKKIAQESSEWSRPRPLFWAKVRQPSTISRLGYAVVLAAMLIMGWWALHKTPAEAAAVPLDPYLTRIERFGVAEAIEDASVVLDNFGFVDALRAGSAAGVAHVMHLKPLPSFELVEQRLCNIQEAEVVQLVYSDGKQYFSVFVAPGSIDFEFAKREISPWEVNGIACRKVQSSSLATYWFGAGGFHCVLVSPFDDLTKNASVIRYFVSAHQ